ncbi:xanthine dehydrogenase molybdopterin binding subunit [Thioclava sp. L04-15]|uniref:xanthine dehydrogenase molybdopterin binding subunit n=1 Tax=Thioclava sp. L04-15 TaxID=1915318 RepID=UPI0009989E57|nr:xanthine dehydrogenase molybdopterin binding subunit [Thioclava sp. L04-15]OOY27415.1 xanthine dehydrogenase molybdopterin binding subunit [Thioclava sp. L04-15]TNE83434.1 MAG: xanthine dehydrogenase molybdopterin binding subunit [Paracoccaceae bacterium]
MSVGTPKPHDSAQLHVTGAARYVDDIPCPATTLHLAFGLSTEAHAEITALDLSAVRTAPGVIAVMTAEDMPFANNASPAPEPEPVLAEGVVKFVGQPIFVIAATSHLAARKAARLAKIDYAPRPAILTVEDALEAKSHFEGGPVTWARGDTEEGFAKAEHIVEGSFDMGGQEHFYLEGQAALALPEDQGMVIRCSSQHPSEIQHKVADALGCAMHDVRVEMRRMGGGFGGKESQGNHLAIACAVMARATGRPCKMRYDRDDDMMITGKRHDFKIKYRLGADAEGKIVAAEFTHLARCGWSPDLSLPVCDRAMLHADSSYFLPNIRIESHRLRTNTQSATAFRGFGGPQGMIATEVALDHLAHAMGLDPLDLRKRNYYDPEGGQSTHYGQPVEDFLLPEMTAELQKSAEFAARKAQVAVWNSNNATLKRGISLTPVKFGISFTLTQLNQAGALVHVYSDGSIQLNHGGTEMGQGLHRKVCQVAASIFGVSDEDVRITATATDKVPNTSATAASSGADLNGMAVKAACETIKARLAAFFAESVGCAPEDVEFSNGEVRAGAQSLPFAKLAKLAHEARISLSSTGFYATPKISWDRIKGQGHPFFYFAYGAAVTEVVIDTLTGENRILRTDILHDAGASLNPALDIGQIEGGYVQGAGWLTTEELVWDDKGRLRTHAPSTYKIPACSDRPRIFNVNLWDEPNREDTIYRSKAVGEPPFMLAISAFLALEDACKSCGPNWPDLQAPATPESVLAAVHRARGDA